MNNTDKRIHRSLWNRCLWTVAVVLWLTLAAGGTERTAAAPTPMATPAVLADVLTPRIYFSSIPQIHTTPHFQIVNGRDPQWSTHMGDMLEVLYGAFSHDMAGLGFAVSEPSEPLTWLCFDNKKAFVEYARNADSFIPSWLHEYYSPRTNRVAVVSSAMTKTVGMDTGELSEIMAVSHEAAHQFSYSTGVFKRGVMYPVWLTEGVAMSFETDSIHRLGMKKLNTPRMRQLIQVRREGRMLPIRQLVEMVHFRPDEGHDVGDLYAQADGFFRFMLSNRTEHLRGYIARMGMMKCGRRSVDAIASEFKAAFGTAEAIEAEWNAYLDKVELGLDSNENISPATPPMGGIAGLVTPVVNR